MTLVETGQIVAFPYPEGGPTRIWTVKGTSTLKNRKDRRAFFIHWEPGQNDGVWEVPVTFKDGILVPPYRLLDLHDPHAMVARVAEVVGDPEVALRCVKAMFRGPNV